MRSLLKILAVILVSFLSFEGKAQVDKVKDKTVSEIVGDINKAYESYTSYSAEVSYEMYDSLHVETPLETQKGKMVKQGDKQYNQLGDIILFSNKDCIIQLDKGMKSLVYMQNQSIKNGAMANDYLSKIDKILEGCGSSSIGGTKNQPWIKLEGCDYSIFKEIVIKYNPTTFAIQEMALTNDEGEKLKIVYSKVKVNKSVDQSVLNVSNYLIGTRENAQPSAQYKDFLFENYFNQKAK
jgi:outer membrane lipoprotein-sorting protein